MNLLDCLGSRVREEETVEGMQEEGPDHSEETSYDEHIWLSLKNAIVCTETVRDALCGLDPDHAAVYEENTEKYIRKLDALDSAYREAADLAGTGTLLFADRFPFRYLTDAYGWKCYAAFSGCTRDTDASPATLSFLISKVKSENIKTVFYLENSSQKIADAVCAATGAHAEMLQSCNNVTRMDYDAGMHYQQLMTENLDAIEEALK